MSPPCPPGWTWFGGRCFIFNSSKEIWPDAEETVWMWSDGSQFDFINWASGQPDNAGGIEDCMEINYGGDYVSDAGCNSDNSFVCVRDP
ncbi:hypothetical protein ACER0C_023756 [Sarotherodon galilaeus]